MSELRRDPVSGRWVILSTEHRTQLHQGQLESLPRSAPDRACPFCEGYEHMTPRELLAWRRNGNGPNQPGWDLRVVPNHDPLLRIEGGFDRRGEGLFDRMNGVGAHEVIVESPRHEDTLATMEAGAVERVLWAFRDRVRDLKQDRRFRYIILVKNHDVAAGTALAHSCSQLIALPMVPREVREEVDGARAHYRAKERCVFCDLIRQELTDRRRVIAENADIVALAPFASRFPFETWLLPRHHQSLFEDASRQECASLARLLGDVLRRMNTVLTDPPYNLLLHTAPIMEPAGDYYHWHVEIMPRPRSAAGFGWATGFYWDSTGPEEAAHLLRNARA